jgi:hypothetical protein
LFDGFVWAPLGSFGLFFWQAFGCFYVYFRYTQGRLTLLNKTFITYQKKKIMDLLRKKNIPLNNIIMNSQIIHHHCIFVPHYTKKSWKALLQGSIPTPPIMPKTNM